MPDLLTYNTWINGDQRDIVYTVAAVEKKNPNDWNPKKAYISM